jgi:hypothetical protein
MTPAQVYAKAFSRGLNMAVRMIQQNRGITESELFDMEYEDRRDGTDIGCMLSSFARMPNGDDLCDAYEQGISKGIKKGIWKMEDVR